MTADEYRRAIEQPALRAGVRLEPALVDELVGEVIGEPGALPLLSTALLELWERREGRMISLEAYAQTGGVRGAVARLAEDVYAGFDEEQQAIVRSVLLRLAGAGEGAAVVRRRVPLAEFDVERNEQVGTVLDTLTARRLLTVSEGSVEVAHEALLREWPRFQEWLEEDREGRRLHAHLMETAREWAESGRDSADLYRGARLSSALDWTTEHTLDLNEVEREFVNASRAENELELTRQRKHNRRLRGALVGVGVLLVLALIAGVLALVARSNAQQSATAAVAQRLGAQALVAKDLDLSLLLGRQGVALDDSLETRGNLEAALIRSPAAIRVARPISGRYLNVSTSPDGRYVAVGQNDGEVAILDSRTFKTVRTLHQRAPAPQESFATDGRLIVFPPTQIPQYDAVDVRTGVEKPLLPRPKGAEHFALSQALDYYATSSAADGQTTLTEWSYPGQKLLAPHARSRPAGSGHGDVPEPAARVQEHDRRVRDVRSRRTSRSGRSIPGVDSPSCAASETFRAARSTSTGPARFSPSGTPTVRSRSPTSRRARRAVERKAQRRGPRRGVQPRREHARDYR